MCEIICLFKSFFSRDLEERSKLAQILGAVRGMLSVLIGIVAINKAYDIGSKQIKQSQVQCIINAKQYEIDILRQERNNLINQMLPMQQYIAGKGMNGMFDNAVHNFNYELKKLNINIESIDKKLSELNKEYSDLLSRLHALS